MMTISPEDKVASDPQARTHLFRGTAKEEVTDNGKGKVEIRQLFQLYRSKDEGSKVKGQRFPYLIDSEQMLLSIEAQLCTRRECKMF